MNCRATGWRCYQGLFFATALFLAALSGCGPEQQPNLGPTGNAQVSLNITMPEQVAAASTPRNTFWATVRRLVLPADVWAATVNEIAALVVQVTGPGIPSPITNRVPVSGARGGQVIPVSLDVPVGADRVFIVSALNTANRPIFQGQSAPLTLVVGQAAMANVQLADITIQITTTTLPDGTEDRPYTATMVAERGSGAVTWAITEGRLPPGVTLNSSTGGMTGTPTAVGIFPFTVRATDTSGLFDEQRLSVTINPAPIPPRITTTALPGGTVGTPYSATLTATGGTGAVTWGIITGTLPPGLTLNGATGAITGTPTTAGTSNFTVRATDTLGLTGEKALSIRINPAPIPPTITTTTLPNGTVGVRYNRTLTATGGTGNVTWSLSSGSLPPGLSLNGTTGAIAGTPTREGRLDFRVRATDTLRLTDEQVLSITIERAPTPPPTITTTTLPSGREGTPYSATLTATGGTGAVTWGIITGTLPPGLTLNGATGAITGTPTTAGTSNFTVRATDTLGLTDEQALVIMVSSRPPPPPVITTTSLPGGTVGASYSAALTATGGTGALTWSVSGGTLPPGLSLNPSNGGVAGTPTTEGSFSFTVRATDTSGLTDSQDLSITIAPSPTITTTSLPDGTVGASYSATLTATGGTGALTWSVIAGVLPPGLTLNGATGAIAGTPTTASGGGPFTFTVRATDTLGLTGERALSIRIN